MNLIGNAVKFTARGFVLVNCSVEELIGEPGEVNIKFEIRQVFCVDRFLPSPDNLTVTLELVYRPLM